MYSQQTGGVYSNSSAYGQSRYGGVSVSQYGYGRPSAPTPVGGTSLASGSMMSADQYSYHGRATPNSGSGAYAQYQPSYNPQHQSSSLHYAPMQHSTTSSRYSMDPSSGGPSQRYGQYTSCGVDTSAHEPRPSTTSTTLNPKFSNNSTQDSVLCQASPTEEVQKYSS